MPLKALRALIVLSAALSVLLAGAPAWASPASAAKQGIEATLVRRAAAWQRRNLPSYLSTFTPDWRSYRPGADPMPLAGLQVSFQRPRAQGGEKPSWSIARIQASGNKALIVMDTYYQYPTSHRNGTPDYGYDDEVESEVWLKTPAGWKEQSERNLLSRTSWSGRPLSMAERRLPAM